MILQVPPEAGYNPTEPHLQWLHDVYVSDAVRCVYTCRRLIDLSNDCRYPKVKDDPLLKPMECVQRAGDVIYVPAPDNISYRITLVIIL